MASAANDLALSSDTILVLDPALIDVGPRIGLFWPDKAAALGRLIATDGQRDPIKVVRGKGKSAKRWTLVAGLHRLEGVRLEGLPVIEAIEVTGSAAELRDIEASENMHRRSFGPIEWACFVRATADAAEERVRLQHGGLTAQQIGIRGRWEAEKAKAPGVVRDDDLSELEAQHTTANLAGLYGWSSDVAAALGMSERSLYRDLALHRAIVAPFPHLYRDLAVHPTVGENASQLREIVAVKDEAARGKLIRELLAHPDINVATAKEQIGLRDNKAVPATGATKFMNNALSNIGRLSVGQQRDFLPALLKALKPSVIDLLEAQIATFKAGGGK
ncbi:MAG: hypothetical protein DI547_16875 [Sphingobium sp.]|nr:MAG: hypothetical protein DI547_16875 [Sphingobium sp.]